MESFERLLMSHLLLDLLGRVGDKDGRGDIRGAHLAAGTLQRRKELGVNQRGLDKAETRCHVTRHAEVRIL